MTDKPKWTDLFGIDPDYTGDAIEEPKYTESELRVLTEAALRLGRKEAGEEIAAQIAAELDEFGPRAGDYATGMNRARRIAVDIAQFVAGASPDASSARTDLTVDTDLPQAPEAGREAPSDPPGPGLGHRRCDCDRGHPIDICAECGEDWPCEEAP